MAHNTQPLRLTLHHGDQLSPHVNQTIIDLCTRAFEEDFIPLMATFQKRNLSYECQESRAPRCYACP